MKQSFAWWSFVLGRTDIQPEVFLDRAAATGVTGVEMLPAELWPVARSQGLAVVTANGHQPIPIGFNDAANHPHLQAQVRAMIEVAHNHSIRGLIVFSGNRNGLDNEPAIMNCAEGLRPLAEEARQADVVLLLEALNSKVDHPGYQCDRTSFARGVIETVDSPALRILYDAYHMQLMEGDLLRTIKANISLIGHIHTGGVPGRRELDDRQETNWRAVAGTLRHLGYDHWVGHEFIPRGDPFDTLRSACAIFDGAAMSTSDRESRTDG